jgi:hypothetical protein
MSIPNKRYVLQNWKDFQHVLPAEILVRFDQILKSGSNLEPRDARYYFKQLKRNKRKELRRRKRICKRRREALKRGDMLWLKNEIAETTNAIVKFIKNEPLFMLNFQQMMTSDELLRYLCRQRVVKVRTRNTRCAYKKTIIEISDKLIKWMDTMSFFAEIQPLDSKEKILEIPSLESLLGEETEEEEEEEGEEEGEGEGESEEGEEESEEGWDEDMEGLLGEESGAAGDASLEEFMAKKLLDKTKLFEQYEGEGSVLDMLRGLDEDILEKLIQILSESPEDFLQEEIDAENLPGVTYGDILNKLREIRDGNLLEAKRDKIFLEDKMIEWAKNNDPERVDDKVLDKIHETSTILAEWFKNVDLGEFKKGRKPGEFGDELLEGEEGEMGEPVDETFDKTLTPQLERGGPIDEAEGEEFGGALIDKEGGLGGGEGGSEEELLGEEDLREGLGEGLGDEFGEEGGFREEGFGEGGFEGGLGTGEGEEGLEYLEGLEAEALEGEELGMEEFGEGEEFQEGEGFGKALGEGEEEEEEEIGRLADELERLDSLLGIIRGHKPSVVFEHEPGTICCLSLKIWAVWLLEIANNAHKWTKWIGDIIKQVRHYAAIIRGDVVLPNGEKKVLYKEEWRKFVRDTEEKVIAWRQYSKHVKDLSNEIMENFHGKRVTCCPKCLQDHLIKNVVTAHETLQALTEAINCAGYWQRCLDRIVEQTSKITEMDVSPDGSPADVASLASEESYTIEIEELTGLRYIPPIASDESYDSIYEIEELQVPAQQYSEFEIVEFDPLRRTPRFVEIEDLTTPTKTNNNNNNSKPATEDGTKPKKLKSKLKKKH